MDVVKVIVEVIIDFIEVVSSFEFVVVISVLVGFFFSLGVTDVFNDINIVVQNIESYFDYIFELEDVCQFGYELYQLLCIVQCDFLCFVDGIIDIV